MGGQRLDDAVRERLVRRPGRPPGQSRIDRARRGLRRRLAGRRHARPGVVRRPPPPRSGLRPGHGRCDPRGALPGLAGGGAAGALTERSRGRCQFQAFSKLRQIFPSPAKSELDRSKEKAWISLDSLVRFEPFQWVAPTPPGTFFFIGARRRQNTAQTTLYISARMSAAFSSVQFNVL